MLATVVTGRLLQPVSLVLFLGLSYLLARIMILPIFVCHAFWFAEVPIQTKSLCHFHSIFNNLFHALSIIFRLLVLRLLIISPHVAPRISGCLMSPR